MAVQPSTITNPGSANSLKLVTWTALTQTGLDSGTPFQFADWADRAVQVSGTFGAGGSVLLEGSNDGVNWATVNDTTNNPIVLTAAGIKQMNETPLFVRPRVTAGDGTTAIVVSILARRVVQINV